MQKKGVTAQRFLAVLMLIALTFGAVDAGGVAASPTPDEPDFLVLNPERE